MALILAIDLPNRVQSLPFERIYNSLDSLEWDWPRGITQDQQGPRGSLLALVFTATTDTGLLPIELESWLAEWRQNPVEPWIVRMESSLNTRLRRKTPTDSSTLNQNPIGGSVRKAVGKHRFRLGPNEAWNG
jgi:hypothetical protein